MNSACQVVWIWDDSNVLPWNSRRGFASLITIIKYEGSICPDTTYSKSIVLFDLRKEIFDLRKDFPPTIIGTSLYAEKIPDLTSEIFDLTSEINLPLTT